NEAGHATGNAVSMSPNGEYFYISRVRGELADDLNRQDLIVYKTGKVISDIRSGGHAAICPLATITVRAPRDPVLNVIEWSENSKTILIHARNSVFGSPVYLFDLQTQGIRQVASALPGQEIIDVQRASGGDQYAFKTIEFVPYTAGKINADYDMNWLSVAGY